MHPPTNSIILKFVAVLGVLILGPVAGAQTWNPKAATKGATPGLLRELPAPLQVQPELDAAVVDARFVSVDFDVLGGPDGPLGSPNDRARAVRFDLFPDQGTSFVALLERTEPASPGSYAWIGRLDGIDLSSVTLIVNRAAGMLTGNITAPDGLTYQIRPLGNGIHGIYKVDHGRYPEDIWLEAPATSQPELPQPGTADDGSRLDVMAVYTAAARTAAGGTAAIEALIDLAVSETNQSYANSGITPRMRLVYKGEITYTESGDFQTDVNRLQATSDGYVDNVHTLRNQYGADMVTMVIEGTQYCGIAYNIGGPYSSFASSAFQVTARNCATGYYSFGHEFGHLQGARHDWYVDPTNNSPYTYNHGYYYGTSWRTVMGYGNGCGGCTRLQYWSNPNITYGGVAMGVPEGQTNAADNRKTLNNTAGWVANWRTEVGSAPGAATLVSPSGTISTTTPTYTWNAVTGATNYQLLVHNSASSAVVQGWYTAAEANCTTTCSLTPSTALTAGGSYTWWIQTYNTYGYGPWSNSLGFTVSQTPTVHVTSPNGGESWTFGSVHQVTWTASGLNPAGQLQILWWNGSSWTFVANLAQGTTAYAWTVPSQATSSAMVHVGNLVGGTWQGSDQSDAPFSIVAPANNDEIAGATSIPSVPYEATQNTQTMTSNASDPVHSCSSATADSNTVWYRFVANRTGVLWVGTFGSNYDTVLTAYTGTSSVGAELACSDDEYGTPQSEIKFNVTNGTSYLIEVSDYGTPGGGTLVLKASYDGTKGDFTQDSKVDLLFRHQGSNRNMLWSMNGTSRLSSSWIAPDASSSSLQPVGADDFDGDGKSDLVFWNSSTGAVEFWLMNGASRVGAAQPISGAATLATNWKLAATGDFNFDHRPDLLWRNAVSQKLVLWTMNGTTKVGTVTPTPDQAVDANWEVVAVLDFNDDGNRDLLWYNYSSGKIVLWLMNSSVVRTSGQFTNPANAGAANWKVYAGGDYGVGSGGVSGTNDIVWRNATGGKLVVWHMDAAGNRTYGTFTSPDSPVSDPSGNTTLATDWALVGPR